VFRLAQTIRAAAKNKGNNMKPEISGKFAPWALGGKPRASRNQLARSGMHLFTASLRACHFRRQTRD